MADEGMDPCECIWNHELAMRRLLSLLRQGQSYCTEAECLDELSPLATPGTTSGNGFLMIFLIIAFAVLMYVMRPSALRQREGKNPTGGQGPSGEPPAPPAEMN